MLFKACLVFLLCAPRLAAADPPQAREDELRHVRALQEYDALCREHEGLGNVASSLILSGERIDADAVRQALTVSGVSFADVRTRSGQSLHWQERTLQEMRGFQEVTGEKLQCGRASGPDREVWMFSPGGGELVCSEDEGRILLRATLEPHFTEGRVYLQCGSETSLFVLDSDSLDEAIPSMQEGCTAQLVATDGSGPHPIAVCRVGAPTDTVRVRTGSFTDTVAELRLGLGLPALTSHRLLARAAQRYAEEVCGDTVLRHVGARGDPVARLAAVGVQARRVTEVLARSESFEGAVQELLASPAHRSALLDHRATHLGVGVVRGPQVCVVGLLATFPRYVGETRE